METKHLDNLINDLETLKSRNWLSELGQETLNEYKAIKQALSQHDVIKNEVAVCDCLKCGRKITDLSEASYGWLCDDC